MLFRVRQVLDLGEFLNLSGPEFRINKVGMGDDSVPALPAL